MFVVVQAAFHKYGLSIRAELLTKKLKPNRYRSLNTDSKATLLSVKSIKNFNHVV